MVYVLSKNGTPLMPTTRLGKVRRLIKNKHAIIVQYHPFTIQLLYDTENHVQHVSLGVDAGSKHVGFSATTTKKVLFEAQLDLRTDMTIKIATRKEYRQARRQRKTRYRPARFNNRKKTKSNGWLAPSTKSKIDCHIYWINRIKTILPISKITIETAQFDIQLLTRKESAQNGINPKLDSKDTLFGFRNVREYVLFRDNYTCQNCKGKCKDKFLHVHHIESRKSGGDAPNNLVTLCRTCHEKYHKGEINLKSSIHRGKPYRDAAFMGIMRKTLFKTLNSINVPNVYETYGYITKQIRHTNSMPKSHIIDARCISGNPLAKSSGRFWLIKKIRANTRQLYKGTIHKNGVRYKYHSSYEVYGFRLYDTVLYNGSKWFVSGRRENGKFNLVKFVTPETINSVNYKKLIPINHNSTNLMEEGVINILGIYE